MSPKRLIRRRRKTQKSTPENHPESYREMLKNPIANMGQIIDLIRAIGIEADQKRATVLIDDFRAEYPDLYEFIGDLVDLEPWEARDELIGQWPWMIGMKFYKDHLQVIDFLQTQIKLRREGNHGNNSDPNQQRQIANRS
jgi:hypothetical protein